MIVETMNTGAAIEDNQDFISSTGHKEATVRASKWFSMCSKSAA